MDAIINAAKNKILSTDIQVISFDLFDTLVCRPVLHTKDMLRLFARRIKSDYRIDIENERLHAQTLLNNPYLSLSEIWEYIAKQKGLLNSQKKEFSEKEFEFDLAHITPKTVGKQLFEHAKSTKKPIVVISDMYYTSSQLRLILEKCGYVGVSTILVSCEQRAMKRTGDLFQVMLDKTPSISSSAYLHIGDSIKADYYPAIILGMQAIHIPSNRDLLLEHYGGKDILPLFGDTLYESFIYGTAINFLCSNAHIEFSLEFFAHMLLYPMLLHIGLFLINNEDIQQSDVYQSIHFASRDGFLMKQAYDRLKQLFPDSLSSEYLLTSRAACGVLEESNYWERVGASYIPEDGTLLDYLNVSVTNESLKQQLQAELSPLQLSHLIKYQRQTCEKILCDYSAALQVDFKKKKNATQRYYYSKIGTAKRVLLVDCGFNGTIASMLTKGFQGRCKFDKVYLWGNKRNSEKDMMLSTMTFTIFTEKRGHCLAPMVETFFSECDESCIGFTEGNNGEIVPLFEPAWCSPAMLSDITFAQRIALTNVDEICNSSSDIIPLLELSSLDSIMNLVQLFFADCDNAPTIFKNIRFKETYSHCISSESLETMMIRKSKI